MNFSEQWERFLTADSHLQIFVFFTLFLFMFYATLYLFDNLNSVFKWNIERSTQIQGASRIISSINAVAVTIITLYVLLTEKKFATLENKVK